MKSVSGKEKKGVNEGKGRGVNAGGSGKGKERGK